MPIVAKSTERSEKDERLYRIRHSAAHLMAEAVQALFPGTKLAFGPPIEDGFYYDFDTEHTFNEDDLKAIEKKMEELRQKKAEFVCIPVSKADALKRFQDMGEKLKAEHVETLEDGKITLYQDGDFIDLCAGPHVEHTGEIKHFKLMHSSGSYWRGDEKRERLQRIYGTAWESKDELKGYLHRLEEAKKRDHRVLGKELGLVDFPELAGPGLPFYLPPGAHILQSLKNWMWELHEKGGYGHTDKVYQPLNTPHILKTDAWHTSGHLQNYRDAMFMVYSLDELESGMIGGDNENSKEGLGNYGLKPMNCPGHVMLYNVGTKSYRDMPVRYFEFGTVYRYERQGVLHGLLRVRSFTQDDAHIFCTPEQYEAEIEGVFDFCCHIWDTFGFDYHVALKTRGEKSMGSDEIWEMAEAGLRKVLDRRAPGKYYVEEGDAAFYGPKIDFVVSDSLGRSWQGSTIQLDFNLPNNFAMEYVDSHGERQRPVMIHRAILGSFERFFGLLIEEFGGAFPLWLAPEQVRVLPITDAQNDYAHQVCDELRRAGLLARVDDSSEKLGKKIRGGKTHKVPYLVVVGGQEMENNTITVEGYFDGKLADITTVNALEARMRLEIDNKVARRREE
ncbi:MAG: threonine--tRNA ligase [Planctomycetales bacterium]|nr:threonine--tRNA ligase [bacterium]UNM08459.1 MAG: threonine--tRNA ligase [Planctomycetales bacterium]